MEIANKMPEWEQVYNDDDLHHAAKLGDLKIVQNFTTIGTDPNACKKGNTALGLAAMNGHEDVVRYFIEIGADINKFEREGLTPLSHAALAGHLEIVRSLIRNTAKIDICDSRGRTALAYSAEKGHLDVVQYLVLEGADVNKVRRNEMTPLAWAVSGDHLEIAKFLIDNGATNSSLDDGSNILTHSIKTNSLEIVRALVAGGVNINRPDENGKTPLQCALEVENSEIIEYLLKSTLHFSVTPESNTQMFLRCAIKSENSEIVKSLVENDISLNKPDDNHKTPLQYAIETENLEIIKYLLISGAQFSIHSAFLDAIVGGNLEIVQLLIDSGAKVNYQYKNGSTPLLEAIEAGRFSCVVLLMNNGADPNLAGKDKSKPLAKSLDNKQFEIARYLIKNQASIADLASNSIEVDDFELAEFFLKKGSSKGGSVNLKKIIEEKQLETAKGLVLSGLDVKNETPALMKCLGEKYTDLAKLLIDRGVNLNVPDDSGFTPLTKSVQMNDYEMVKHLVAKGAFVNQFDYDRKIPLTVAASNFNFKIFDYLVDAGAYIDIVEDELDELAKNNEDFDIYLTLLRSRRITNPSDSDAESSDTS